MQRCYHYRYHYYQLRLFRLFRSVPYHCEHRLDELEVHEEHGTCQFDADAYGFGQITLAHPVDSNPVHLEYRYQQ